MTAAETTVHAGTPHKPTESSLLYHHLHDSEGAPHARPLPVAPTAIDDDGFVSATHWLRRNPCSE